MAAITAYKLEEAQEMLALCKEALKELISGQSREFTALDVDDLMDQIVYFSNLVEALSGGVRTKRVARVVPRDL